MRLLALAVAALTIAVLAPLSARADHGGKVKHSHRYQVAQKVNHGLQGTPLHGLGFVFEAAGWKFGLSPYFLAGASGTESSLGAAPCSGNPKNIWGLGACGRAWNEPHFPTWKSAITYYAHFIKRLWPHADTVYELHGYCPPCGSHGWGAKTLTWMQLLFGDVGESLAYPKAGRA